MKRFFGSSAVRPRALAASLAAAFAQAPAPSAPAAKATKVTKTTKTTTTTTTDAQPKVGGVRGSFLFQIDQAQDKLLQLANAIPADKYAWKPGDGVRSVGEVF